MLQSGYQQPEVLESKGGHRAPVCSSCAGSLGRSSRIQPGSCSRPAADASHLEAPALKVQLQLYGNTVLGKVRVGWEDLGKKDGAVSQGSGLATTTP